MRAHPDFRDHPHPFEAPVYRAVVEEVVDGDTVYVTTDQGFFDVGWKVVRLEGVDTPEIRGPNADLERGYAAMEFVESLVLGKPVRMKTERIRGQKERKSLGRFRARIEFVDECTGEWVDLAEAIIEAGHEK